MRKYGARFAITIVCVLIYFFVLRPLRSEFNTYIYHPIVEESIAQSDQLFEGEASSSVSSRIIFGDGIQSGKDLFLKVPFGLHFLLAVIGLALIGSEKSFYLYLLSVQVGGSLIALLFLYLGSLTSVQFLIISDLLVRYLIPLCSLGMVPLVFIYQRQSTHER